MSKLLNKRTPSPSQIAKKFRTSLDKIRSAIKAGSKVEHEHTTKDSVAREIATDHVGEDPKYYKKLKQVEKK